jgi:IS30 family transposase
VPFGYRRTRDGISIEIDPEQATDVQRIYALARAGKSIRQIAAEVDKQPTVVDRILRRDDYKRGERKIIDPRLWNATQAALAKRRKSATN